MAKWRNKIELKKYLSNDYSNSSVLKVVNGLLPQLKYILSTEHRYLDKANESVMKENIEYYTEQLEELIEEFDWIRVSIDGDEDPKEYSYDNWCEALNNYLEQLYDLGDSVVKFRTHFEQEKFLWVG
jgi:hypothetical protein